MICRVQRRTALQDRLHWQLTELSLIRILVILRFLTYILFRQVNFILKRLLSFLLVYAYCHPKSCFNTNLYLIFNVLYFIWLEIRITFEQDSVIQKNKRVDFVNGDINITSAPTQREQVILVWAPVLRLAQGLDVLMVFNSLTLNFLSSNLKLKEENVS